MIYPAKITPDGDAFMVTFRDIPEAITQGATPGEAMAMGAAALADAMGFYFEDRRQVPPPSKARRGEVGIELASSVAVKVLLLNEMIEQKVSAAELARRLGTTPQVVTRIVDITHATKMDTISAALGVLGKRLELTVHDA